MMNNKTECQYWDNEYKALPAPRLKSQLWVGTRDYYHLLGRFVKSGYKVLDIGCAPGKTLAWVAKKKKAEVTGIDYSRRGVEVSEWLFQQMGLQGRFLCEDLFHTTLPEAAFDLVISTGFIEHFDDPVEAINAHVRLVKPGGVALITIPNYGGIYGTMQRFFNPDNLRIHNLNMMSVDALERLALKNKFSRDVKTYTWGSTHPFLVHFANKLNKGLVWALNMAWNGIGWVQPVHIPALAPLLVLEIHCSDRELNLATVNKEGD